ncbi:MAG: DUF1015 family protein [Proteobacteria bacterium]|nr:DUF1015 family protein [Cystobacterineae bacterium]MCL2258828.1 DUF1015 family protein [Cystobacterineae bacterium]MCL2314805.1 DUF1015 family protein [Pseudomonadota bacterium]
MRLLFPFVGWCPPAPLAPRLSAPPYDVISRKEATALRQGNPQSYVRISRPEVDLPEEVDEHSPEAYAKGRENLELFEKEGWLLEETRPQLYAYEQSLGTHCQLGLVGCFSVEAYESGRIKRHELTRKDKEDDRTYHLDALGAHDEPVFLAYRDNEDISTAMQQVTQTPPRMDFTSEDGVGHRFWNIPQALEAPLLEAFERLECLYIADGHHRSAAAWRIHAQRRPLPSSPPGEHHVFLAVAFPDSHLRILPYNRLALLPPNLLPEQLLQGLLSAFHLRADGKKQPTQKASLSMLLAGQWWSLQLREGKERGLIEGLDVSILQDEILAPLFGIANPREDKRLRFIGGPNSIEKMEEAVVEDSQWVAFSLFPTQMSELLLVSDAGLLMPPKSTWFEPKLRSGLFSHRF